MKLISNRLEDSTKIDDRINDRITYLIEMHIFEALTKEEQEELNKWVALNDENRLVLQEAANQKTLEQGVSFLNETNVVANLERVKEKINKENPFIQTVSFEPTPPMEQLLGADPELEAPVKPMIGLRKNWKWLAAAVVIFVAGIGMAYYMSIHDPVVIRDIPPGNATATLELSGANVLLDPTTKDGTIKVQNGYTIKKDNGQLIYEAGPDAQATGESDHVVSTKRAGMYPITLSDGTKLWLNPSSSVSYPPVFPVNERKVTITGEVYFEVAKATTRDGRKKPFIVDVKGKDTRVEVLGTHFNINAYADEPSVKTTLVEGSVKIVTSKEALLLKPGEQAEVIDHTIKVTAVGEQGTRAIKASKEGNFDFQKSDIKSLLREIGRWYDVDVQYPADMQERHFAAQMSRNTNLSEVIKALNLNGINCKLKGKKLIVMP